MQKFYTEKSRKIAIAGSLCLGLLAGTAGTAAAQSQGQSGLSLTYDVAKVPVQETRAGVLGHNMTAQDWHGVGAWESGRGTPPAVWDIANDRPVPAWEPFTTAYPLHVLRYHSGNNYDWRKVVGPRESRRPIKASVSWSGPYRPEAGMDEFLRWAQSLPGQPEVTMIASPFMPVKELEDLVAYCNATSGPMAELRAANGHPAPYNVKYWELGNETDWEKRADLDILRAESDQEVADKITPEEYVALCRERIEALRKIDPTIRFFAHAQTAPWPASNPQWRGWHREVLRGIGAELDGIVIHPYYDGYSIPYVLASVDALIADIKAIQPQNRFGRPLGVVVNEHAKWINPSKRENWPMSWSQQGAISTGDFLLHLMARPEVSMANYWCFIHQGPWRVINTDARDANPDKQRIPTAIHHLFKALNDGLLPRFQLLGPDGSEKPSTGKGAYPYTVTAGLFSDPATGAYSLVAINRSASEAATINLKGLKRPRNTQAEVTLIAGDSLSATNTPDTPDAVSIVTTTEALVNTGNELRFELPAGAIALWSWE